MVSTFTPNINLEEPARGDDVGTWDTPVNGNMTLLDLTIGSIATILLNNSPVVLSAGQFKAKQLSFGSTLTGNVVITFPTSFTKSYEIANNCTGSSAFTITLQTTGAGGLAVCCPPGETVDVFNDGASIKFKNLGRVGSYMDYAGSSVPNWVSGCTIPPYLNCDGTAFNTINYPSLFVILGSSLVPDRRGTAGATLNQGTARITSAISALDGNTRFAVGGDQQLVAHTHNVSGGTGSENATHTHAFQNGTAGNTGSPIAVIVPIGTGGGAPASNTESANHQHSMNFTSGSAGLGGSNNMPPTTIYGITMIRAG